MEDPSQKKTGEDLFIKEGCLFVMYVLFLMLG
jgi:hypothetical protein